MVSESSHHGINKCTHTRPAVSRMSNITCFPSISTCLQYESSVEEKKFKTFASRPTYFGGEQDEMILEMCAPNCKTSYFSKFFKLYIAECPARLNN